MRLGVVIASTREGRFGPTVAQWFAEEVERVGAFDLDVIDLAQIEVPAQPFASHDAAVDLRARVAAADAFVIVTPEYNHSFPGTLKNAIDLAREEWFAKPIAFVSYGGMAGGLRAVEQAWDAGVRRARDRTSEGRRPDVRADCGPNIRPPLADRAGYTYLIDQVFRPAFCVRAVADG
ncbi:NADPH-dependent FMN reductase [Dactylosporangium sp. CA-092794]|uniref:NADPH-dependent FMN reductase n=1 Tax=Dactylosporangium sp. CA-092794 TaxID=3239929 RepID=UPI003D8FF1ED